MQAKIRLLCFLVVIAFTFVLSTHAEVLYACDGVRILRFTDAAPGTNTQAFIVGLQKGETIVGLDRRPANGRIYGLGTTGRMYLIDPISGVATVVNSTPGFSLIGSTFGIDFTPVADRLRIVSNTGQNLRTNPNDGSLTGTDGNLTETVQVTAIAYDRNDLNPATPTTLYGIDAAGGNLVRIGSPDGTPTSPNTGTVTVIGSLGVGTNLDRRIGFDISALSGIAYATISLAPLPPLSGRAAPDGVTLTTRLYAINLSTGQATQVGNVNQGTSAFSGLAIASSPTASTVSVSGRVVAADGRGITNATLQMTNSMGEVFTARSGRRGMFVFDDLPAGDSYVVSISSRRFVFEPRVITVIDNVTDLDFIALQ
jgi:hypothetical protein